METHPMKDTLRLRIDSLSEQLHSLSRDIWLRPELGGEETFAHDRLLRFFSQEDPGWTVQSRYELPTAFRATWGPAGGGGCEPALNVGFLCEYDALPGIGHACGHNLIAEAGAAAAAGLRAAVDKHRHRLPVPVQVTVLGTPAEENSGGKIDLLEAGAFADLDLVFMAHPAQQDASFLPGVALDAVSVKYHGKASHAGAYPWEGVNALDAAVLAYNNVSVLRQQMKPEWRIHGIIAHGGEKPNIIPAYTELEFYLRTPLLKDLRDLKAKAEACFRAAAVATGCQVEIIYPSQAYSSILPNATLSSLYERNGKFLSVQFAEQPQNFSGGCEATAGPQVSATLLRNGNRNLLPGSTDFGNVSFVLPGIHPFFYIGTDAFNHTEEYAGAAGAETAQLYTLRTAKALAMTAVDVVCCPDLLSKVREDFSLAKLKQEK